MVFFWKALHASYMSDFSTSLDAYQSVCTGTSLRPRQNGRHFPDDIFKCISLNENVWISIKISLNFIPRGPINNIPSLVRIMAWRRPAIIWANDGLFTDAYTRHSASMSYLCW